MIRYLYCQYNADYQIIMIHIYTYQKHNGDNGVQKIRPKRPEIAI